MRARLVFLRRILVRYQRVLDRSGISDALRESGISEGDDVQIGIVW